MSIKTYNVKLNGKVYEVEIEEVKAGSQPTMSATPSQAQKHQLQQVQDKQ